MPQRILDNYGLYGDPPRQGPPQDPYYDLLQQFLDEQRNQQMGMQQGGPAGQNMIENEYRGLVDPGLRGLQRGISPGAAESMVARSPSFQGMAASSGTGRPTRDDWFLPGQMRAENGGLFPMSNPFEAAQLLASLGLGRNAMGPGPLAQTQQMMDPSAWTGSPGPYGAGGVLPAGGGGAAPVDPMEAAVAARYDPRAATVGGLVSGMGGAPMGGMLDRFGNRPGTPGGEFYPSPAGRNYGIADTLGSNWGGPIGMGMPGGGAVPASGDWNPNDPMQAGLARHDRALDFLANR